MAELHFGFFLEYFNFLDGFIGRGLFIVFLGSILLSNQVYAVVVGVIIIVVGIGYMVIGNKGEKDGGQKEGDGEGAAAGPKVGP
jgi:hypothetical protein